MNARQTCRITTPILAFFLYSILFICIFAMGESTSAALDLRLAVPERNASYSIGDLYPKADLKNPKISVLDKDWRDRLKSCSDSISFEEAETETYVISKDGKSEIGVQLPFKLSTVKLSTSRKTEMCLLIKGVRRQTLSTDAAASQYAARYRYYQNNARYGDGCYILTGIVTADEIYLTNNAAHNAIVEGAYKEALAVLTNRPGFIGLTNVSTNIARILGRRMPIAFNTWKVESIKGASVKNEQGILGATVSFRETYSGGSIRLVLPADDKNKTDDIGSDNEYYGSASILNHQTNGLLQIKVEAGMLGQNIPPRSHYATLGGKGFELHALAAYSEHSRIDLLKPLESQLTVTAISNRGQFVQCLGSGPLISQWQFERYQEGGSLKPKYCTIKIEPFNYTVSKFVPLDAR